MERLENKKEEIMYKRISNRLHGENVIGKRKIFSARLSQVTKNIIKNVAKLYDCSQSEVIEKWAEIQAKKLKNNKKKEKVNND